MQSIDGKTYFDLANAEIKQTTTIGGKVVTVTISPNRPFELSIDGRKHVYITDSTGKSGSGVLVTNICDVNEDGVVDWDDLLLVRSHVLYGTPTLAEYPRMDVNGDGVVNAADLTMIRRAMVRSDYVEDGYSNTKLGVNDIGVYVTNPSGVTSYIHTW